MIGETRLSAADLVMPLFVCPGKAARHPIRSMPGQFRYSIDTLVKQVLAVKERGIPAVLLFGVPPKKDPLASGAYRPDGIVQEAVRRIKDRAPGMAVITDVCLCEYTDHGHCGVLRRHNGTNSGRRQAASRRYEIDNDATLELLAMTAVSHAEAGADMVAPSAMMDGQAGAIRAALDASGMTCTPIMAYSAKYASAFYGPFREAAESPPKFGDRESYQMDRANAEEAIREVALDIAEGADVVMIKPALAYLDIVRRVKEKFKFPLAAYNVSGEYAMVKAAAMKGWIDEAKTVMEILLAIKRAGADIIITYHALAAAGSWRR